MAPAVATGPVLCKCGHRSSQHNTRWKDGKRKSICYMCDCPAWRHKRVVDIYLPEPEENDGDQ